MLRGGIENMEYILVLIPVLLIVIMGWDENEGKGGCYQDDLKVKVVNFTKLKVKGNKE